MLKIGSLGLRLNCIVLFMMLSSGIHAQQNYIPGYIINIDGDTLKGYINYQNWGSNPKKVYFKKEIKDKAIKYVPATIEAFATEDDIYISAIIDRSLSSKRVNKLDDYDKLNLLTDTLFLQAVMLGPKSLYYHKSHEGIENFYIKDGENITLLEYKKYIKTIDQKEIITEVKTYILQLKEYFKDCESIQGSLISLEYGRKQMENIFSTYYEKCSTEGPGLKKIRGRLLFKYGVKAGISRTTLHFSSDVYEHLADADYKSSIDYTLGICADIILARNRGKWSLNNELVFTKYEVDGVYNDYDIGGNYAVINTKLGFSHLKLNTSVKYRFKMKDSDLYLNAGASHGLILQEISNRVDETYYPSGHSIQGQIAIPAIKELELGRIFGIGWQKKRYSVEMRYERGTGISNVLFLGDGTRRFFLLVGYEFNR